MRASARLVAEATRAGPTRLVEVSASAPFAVRETPDGVFLVGSAQGLVGSDELELDLVVGDGASLTLRTAAASIAYASSCARLSVTARIGAGGSLIWHPEPLIATSRCHLSVTALVELDLTAALDWTDECVLGRAGEGPGDLNLVLCVDHAGQPALRHGLAIGVHRRGWDGPAVLGGHRAVGVRALLDGRDGGVLRTTEVASGPGWAVLPLALGGCAITAVGADLLAMRSALATANERLCDQRHSNAPVSSLDVP